MQDQVVLKVYDEEIVITRNDILDIANDVFKPDPKIRHYIIVEDKKIPLMEAIRRIIMKKKGKIIPITNRTILSAIYKLGFKVIDIAYATDIEEKKYDTTLVKEIRIGSEYFALTKEDVIETVKQLQFNKVRAKHSLYVRIEGMLYPAYYVLSHTIKRKYGTPVYPNLVETLIAFKRLGFEVCAKPKT